MMAKMFYEMVGRLFSRAHMKRLGLLLESSGFDVVPEEFAGATVIICFLAAIVSYFSAIFVTPVRELLFKFSMFISTEMTVSSPEFYVVLVSFSAVVVPAALICLMEYVTLLLMADSRKRKVEAVLPDFLSLAAANVRAGMTVDQAMWYAAKPEFGILSEDISIVSKRTFGGVPFNQSINYLAERFNSKSIKRAVSLIKQGMASGGKLADILERTAEENRQMQILKQEISTSLLMYVIFIVFAGAIGTPFLFAISGKLVSILEGVFSTLPTESYGSYAGQFQGSFAMPTAPSVSSSDFFLFTILSSIMTAVFSCLIIGVISKGSKKDGLPYLPILLFVSLAIFFLVSHLLDSFLANIYV